MIAISFKFLAGRYHATPWGRHVNEGAVEWPPSPWRILRALVATWKRTLPDMPETEVKPILQILADKPPNFVLPPASTGHTRHYMPWFKKGPDDRTLVFDTFVALPRDAYLRALWSDASLTEAQRGTLAGILANLNTLGRSESWCEATLLDPGGAGFPPVPSAQPAARLEPRSTGGQWVSKPLNGNDPPPNTEIVRLLCPDTTHAFADDHVATVTTRTAGRNRNQQTSAQRTTIYDPAWNLCMETLQLHRERWSDPPGSRWVQYARPRDCFKSGLAARPRRHPPAERCMQVVRYAIDSTVLPPVTETLPVAEAARRALMSIHGRITERNGVRGRSPIFSGKDENSHPLAGHGHAYYLPTDEDRDGRLDHLTVFVRGGFGEAELRALDRLRELNTGRKGEERHPLRMLLLGLGPLDEYRPGPLRESSVWVSATPYIAARYAKIRGRNRVDMTSPQARAEFLMADLREQLGVAPAESAGLLDGVKITPEWDDHRVFRLLRSDNRRALRPIQFKRFRSKPGDDGGRRLAGAFRIEFRQPVPGPIALGYSSHFGMGLFLPLSNQDSRGAEPC